MENVIKAVLSTGTKGESSNFDKQLSTSCRQFFTQRVEFHPANRPDSYLEHLKARYKPLNRTMETEEAMDTSEGKTSAQKVHMDDIPHPKVVLFDAGKLELKWKHKRPIGAGLSNMGNTCFLNSVLQCLSYTPPLINYLLSEDHKQRCRMQGFCALCELQRHCTRAFNASGGIVRPVPIVQNLKAIARHFRQGRQEDAHEFLRYFVDGLQKSCLQGLLTKLDPHSKATTVMHHIFGGYHRSQVKCLACLKTSDTFDPLLDISLDIKTCPSLVKALQKSTKPDLLDGENKYACPFCKEMTRAQKKFTLHRLPKVLTVQLKRFDYNNMFGGKINKPVMYTEHLNMRPYMSDIHGPSQWYRLFGVLVHFGFSCHSGHYYCYVKNSNGTWYCMNDSQVTQVSVNTALNQEAYLLFYIKDDSYKPPTPSTNTPTVANKPSNIKDDPNFLGTPVKRSPGVDKTGTPLVKLAQKPTGVVTPSPQSITPSVKQFSIPLRKASTAGLVKLKVTPPPAKVEAPPLSHLQFTPRVIATPQRPKKPQKVPAKVGTEEENDKMETTEERTILDIAEMKITNELSPPDTTPVKEQTFIGPLLPPCLQPPAPSSPSKTFIGPLLPPCLHSPPPTSPSKAFALKSPTSKSPKVAFVPPQPHSNVKPVARVLPSPHIQSPPVKTETSTKELVSDEPLPEGKPKEPPKADKEEKSNGQNEDSKLATADSTTQSDHEPHLNSKSQWMISTDQPVGPSLPNDYDGTAHGWMVTPLPTTSSSGETSHSVKKHKKKKHRKRDDSQSCDSDLSDLDSNKEKDGAKKSASVCFEKSHKHGDDYVSSSDDVRKSKSDSDFKRPKHKVREDSKSPDKVPHSTTEEMPERHNKHKRHHSEVVERDRSSERHSRKHKHSPSRPRRHRSPSSSDSDTEHRKRREAHRHRSPRRHLVSRHHHHRHRHHSPDYSSEDERKGSSDRVKYESWRERVKHRSHEPRRERAKYHHRGDRHLRERRHDRERDTRWGSSREEWERRKRVFSRRSPSRRSRSPSRRSLSRRSRSPSRRSPSRRSRSPSRRSLSRRSRSPSRRSRSPSRRSPSPQERKRHKSDSTADDSLHREEKKRSSAPETEWDASVREVRPRWDGSQHNDTVGKLTSQTHDKLGDIVKSWDGGENSIDSSVVEEGRKRTRDHWDDELDRGRVKKVRRQRDDDWSYSKNSFQEYQSFKNKSFRKDYHYINFKYHRYHHTRQ